MGSYLNKKYEVNCEFADYISHPVDLLVITQCLFMRSCAIFRYVSSKVILFPLSSTVH